MQEVAERIDQDQEQVFTNPEHNGESNYLPSKHVITYPVTLAQIDKLADQYKEVPADLTVKANYKVVQAAASHLRTLRTDVEKRRKFLKADALAHGKLVDSTAKEITERLVAIEEPFAQAKKDFDTRVELEKREKAMAEERRIDGIVERIAGIKALVEANISSSSAVIKEAIDNLFNDFHGLPEWAMEFHEKAFDAVTATKSKLDELHAMKLQQEQAAQLAAEAEAKRIADEEAAQVERERLAEEARVRLEAEQKKLQEERDKLAAEQKALEAERARIAAEQLAEQTRLHNEKKAREEEAERGRLEGERIQREKEERERLAREEAEMVQLLKDLEAEAVAQRLRDEIEALKNPVAAEVVEITTDKSQAPIFQNVSTPLSGDPLALPADQYRSAGKAMKAIIGDFQVTKNLLDSIIQGNIPYVIYTGEKA